MMNKEANSQNETGDVFWDKFKAERLETGSECYRATEKALEIARMYFSKFDSGSLSEVEKMSMDRYKKEIVEINDKFPIFCRIFNEICEWITTDFGAVPREIRILKKIELLKDKIRRAEQRTDLV